jgi:hypothetical protein
MIVNIAISKRCFRYLRWPRKKVDSGQLEIPDDTKLELDLPPILFLGVPVVFYVKTEGNISKIVADQPELFIHSSQNG